MLARLLVSAESSRSSSFSFEREVLLFSLPALDFALVMPRRADFEPRGGACTFLNFQRTPNSPDTRGMLVI